MLFRLCWYAGEKYLRDLKAKEEFQPRVLESVEALADFLVSETRTMERGTDSAKRQAKEEVPGDRIKDAPALARELRWRVRHAGGYMSDDDSRHGRRARSAANGEITNGVGNKRKRIAMESSEDSIDLFRNFKRPSWDRVEERPTEQESKMVKARRPDPKSREWVREWVGGDESVEVADGGEAQVARKRDVIVKVRKTAKGLERQRVERVLEEWVWTEGAASSATSSAPNSKLVPAAELPRTAEDEPQPITKVEPADQDAEMRDATMPATAPAAVLASAPAPGPTTITATDAGVASG